MLKTPEEGKCKWCEGNYKSGKNIQLDVRIHQDEW